MEESSCVRTELVVVVDYSNCAPRRSHRPLHGITPWVVALTASLCLSLSPHTNVIDCTGTTVQHVGTLPFLNKLKGRVFGVPATRSAHAHGILTFNGLCDDPFLRSIHSTSASARSARACTPCNAILASEAHRSFSSRPCGSSSHGN